MLRQRPIVIVVTVNREKYKIVQKEVAGSY